MEKYTPMIQQYLSVKENYPDAILFYRLGDFYEMFFDDAKIAANILDLVLTGKAAGNNERIPMCGVPFHSCQNYISKLVASGYKVAIVEQLEDPSTTKGLVKRDVVKIVTPGTVVDEMVNEKASVKIASVVGEYTCILCEMATGETVYKKCSDKLSFLQLLLQHNVKELVVYKQASKQLLNSLQDLNITISTVYENHIESAYEGYSAALDDLGKQAYGCLLQYLQSTQKMLLGHLKPVVIESDDECLLMDYDAICNLELTKPLQTTSKNQTLWSFLDHCQSAMGSRKLRQFIERPLYNVEKIEHRYDMVAYLLENFLIRDDLKEPLSHIYDIERILTKVVLRTANHTDVLRLIETLKQVPFIFNCLSNSLFDEFTSVSKCEELATYLQKAVDEKGIAKGFSAELDEIRLIQQDNTKWILDIEASEKEKTGIKTLKVGYNKVFGYYIEVSKGALEQIKPEYGYIRKQTLTNAERFITETLKEKEDEILHAKERGEKLENELFQSILEKIQSFISDLHILSNSLACIDVFVSFAQVSQQYGYKRPQIVTDTFYVKKGKHPILDAMIPGKFIANDLNMPSDLSVYLITGPNMGGKSTYMRQIALLVIMSQMGCFVPAKEFETPLFDKIYTRIGASDDILSGQSTFMVEMMEANHALKHATSHSLILFDEIGRGTSTYDGMALAQAIIEYIATKIQAKTLFSTHYHELTSLQSHYDNIRNICVGVIEKDNQITFTYHVYEGVAKKSYGINVARLAQMPDSLLKRAEHLLASYESHQPQAMMQQTLPLTKENPAIRLIENLDVDDMTPKAALEMLYKLKGVVDNGEN